MWILREIPVAVGFILLCFTSIGECFFRFYLNSFMYYKLYDERSIKIIILCHILNVTNNLTLCLCELFLNNIIY